MLRAPGSRFEHLICDLGIQLGSPCSQYLTGSFGRLGRVDFELAQSLSELQLRGIRVGRDDLLSSSVLVDQIYRAPVRDVGYREPGDVTKRLLIVHRGRKN